jgi:hypothetical protein
MKEEIKNYPFEELKLMYDSAEKVTDRRIDLNKFNYSICTAVFLAIAFLWNWSLSNAKFTFAGIFVVMVFSGMAVVFTFYWIRQIKDYKQLNHAKFLVINAMAKNVYFKGEDKKVIESFEPFQKEWGYLKNMEALEGNSLDVGSETMKASNLEFFIPKAFRIIFCLLFLLSFSSIVFNLSKFFTSFKGVLFVE